jgi:DNA repair photolyase
LEEVPPPPKRNPKNRFLSVEIDWAEELPPPPAELKLVEDKSREILSKNDSPDIGFTYSVNPYRGCFHGCAYCYARPTHEYLGYGAGSDFERVIVYKPRAPALLREAFERPAWEGELVVFSGVTDCYQPLEAEMQLTRGCLEVCAEYRNPVGIITKSPLIERDIDLLLELQKRAACGVTLSIPLWKRESAHALEPYVATPQRRIQTIARLSAAGVRVGVNVAPLIPGLGDEEMTHVLEAAADAGAKWAGTIFLRLPGAVAPVFEERLRTNLPLRAERVLHQIRAGRGGKLNESEFGKRQDALGVHWQATRRLFEMTCARLGLDARELGGPVCGSTFRRPARTGDQLPLL